MNCEHCGCKDADFISNPYTYAMYDKYVEEWICSECYIDLVLSV